MRATRFWRRRSGKRFRNRGIRHLSLCNKTDALLDALDAEIVDLLVYRLRSARCRFQRRHAAHPPQGARPEPLRRHRRDISDSAAETVQRLIGSGIDDLIRKPVSIDRLFESVGTFAQERKPFFVSYNYVGPTRRSGHRALEPANQIIRVPNTLRSRAIEMISDEELTGSSRMPCKVSTRSSSRPAVSKSTYSPIASRIRSGPAPPTRTRRVCAVRCTASRSLPTNCAGAASGTQFERVSELATMVIALTQRVLRAQGPAAIGRGTILVKLSAAIRRALSVERHSIDVMREITKTIANFTRTH